MKAAEPAIGVIGGSGLYELEGLSDVKWQKVQTPFGAPSDAYCVGRFAGRRVIFLPRHGRGQHDGLIHRHRHGGRIAEHVVAGGVADQDEIDARLRGEARRRMVVRGDHHDLRAG